MVAKDRGRLKQRRKGEKEKICSSVVKRVGAKADCRAREDITHVEEWF